MLSQEDFQETMSTIQCPRCNQTQSAPYGSALRDELLTEGIKPGIHRQSNHENDWIDVPCNNCRITFQFNTRTGAVRG